MDPLEQRIKDLEKTVADRDVAIEQHQKKNDEQAQHIATLKAENAKLKNESEKVVLPEPIEVGGKTVKFKFPSFRFKGKRYTAEEAATDKAVIADILKTPGQGILDIVH